MIISIPLASKSDLCLSWLLRQQMLLVLFVPAQVSPPPLVHVLDFESQLFYYVESEIEESQAPTAG